jgi:hypothetical protein
VSSEFIESHVELKNLLRIRQALDTVFRIITNLGRDINGPWRLPNIMKNSVVESPVAVRLGGLPLICAARLSPAALVAGLRVAGVSNPPICVIFQWKNSC